MRYRVFSVLKGSKVVTVVLLLILILLVAVSRLSSHARHRPERMPTNVIFEGKDLGGFTIEEATTVVEQVAELTEIAPVNATLDPTTNGVVPGLNGLRLDVEKTVAAILAAQRGEIIKPIYQQLPPDVDLGAFPQSPIYRGNPDKEQVTFLINVAWGNEYLQEMLDVLSAHNAQATFFLVGRWVRANEAEARLISDAGFEVANHGYSDAISMQEATLVEATDDIRKAADIIEATCGKRPIYFSPHRGELSPDVLQAAADENNRTIMWTVDTVDWTLPGVNVMLEKILTRASGGSLILMHPTEQTAEFLRSVIPKLRKKGLEPVTLTKLLSPIRALKE